MEGCWWGGVSAPRDGVGGCGCCRVYLHAGMRIGGVGDRVYLLPGMDVGNGGVLVRRVYLHRRMGCVGVRVVVQGVSAPRDGVHVLAGWLLVMRVYLYSGMGAVHVCVTERVYLHPGKGRVSAEGCW